MKVFLVEDEVIVREGIRKNINWTQYGLSFVGEASDGEIAYPMIQDLKPDIIITDIKMPFMDGLELSRLIKTEMPWIKIIILSGHDDFEYARKAISIGVTEYLLKPLDSAKIIETVLKVKGIIEQEQEQKKYLELFRQEMQEFEQLERKRFFGELVGKKLTLTELLERGNKLGLELAAQYYNIILFLLSHEENNPESYAGEVIEKEQLLVSLLEVDEHIILFQRDLEGYAILVKGSSVETVNQKIDWCLSQLSLIMEDCPQIQYQAAVGVPVQRLTKLHESFSEASRVYSYRYFMKANKILYAEQTQGLPMVQDIDLNLQSLDTSNIDKKVIQQFLKQGSAEDIPVFVRDFFESLGNSLNSLLFRQYITLDVCFTVIAFIEELGYEKKELTEEWDNLQKISSILISLDDTRSYIANLVSKALELRDLSATRKYGLLLQNAKEYINEAYSSSGICLNEVAAKVNISPSYFSSIFSQETGSTFIEYLTAVRMEKARELLRCSSMKTSEIGYAVGYRDAHYFSYIFKKMNGCTPKEYRTGKSEQAGTV